MTISKMPWVGKLIDEYETTMHELQDYHEKIDSAEERSAVNRLISNLSYSLTWMKHGREPGSRRGAERNYQTTVIYDTELFPSLQAEPEKELTEDEKRMISSVLMILTKRERDIYILHEAYLLTERQISYELNLSRRTVRTYFDRAKEKINRYLSPICRP
ncbi:sigma factor-like helix-turn-helix DNA-binding protein [Sporolactobacillus sp. CQH2019]|uniref:sigma factor-like helix-turn-helix DNA-binding protein n=1 Tax=Sporolactobacillus sp. CQH2019 TaxID=3023512 RepID=UPI0023680967|nr:sigma factor-like helix-turn-helix DNA-binding protein [Sporolactobacillus sp. CQH2019]MDD9148147.1 sigma factor-like helix-turn-helix DNA-binding protein [Sporolactobacillus sp. CQH2019]